MSRGIAVYVNKICVMFSKRAHKALLKLAKERGMSMNALIREAVRISYKLED